MKLYSVFLFFPFGQLFQRSSARFLNSLDLFIRLEFVADFGGYFHVVITCLFYFFQFFRFCFKFRNLLISQLVAYICFDCFLKGDLDPLLLICFPISDFSCCCSVGFSLVRFVSLFTRGFLLMFFFKALVYDTLKLPC